MASNEPEQLVIRMGGRWKDRSIDPEWFLVLGALSDGVITAEIARDWMFGRDGRSFRRLDGQWTSETQPCGCQRVTSRSGNSGVMECCCLAEGCVGDHAHQPEAWSGGTTVLKVHRDDGELASFLDCLDAAGHPVPRTMLEPPPASEIPF